MNQLTTLVLTPDRNARKHDYTGEFRPAALRLQSVCSSEYGEVVHVRQIDVSKPLAKRFEQVLHTIDLVESLTPQGVGRITFLCHGTMDALQLGLTRGNVAKFAKALPREPSCVTLYACSAGGATGTTGDGKLADMLRDAIVEQFPLDPTVDVTVDAHTTAGNASRNPYVRRFARDGGVYGSSGGRWIVEPRTSHWPKWVRALRTDFRFKFPRMTVGEVSDFLETTK